MKKTLLTLALIAATNAQASYTQIDTNNFTWIDSLGATYNVFLSPKDNSCRLEIPTACSVFDVGFITYTTSQTITNLANGSQMSELFGEGIFNDTIVAGGNYYVVDETGNPNTTFKPVYNTDFGFETTGIGAFYYATVTPSAVPVPAALWLFGSGLFGLVLVARRKV